MNITHFLIRLIMSMLLMVVPWALKSQVQADTSKGSKIIIDHFGKLIEDREGIEPVQWISQGLQLRIGQSNVYADSAVIFGENRVYAYGNVVIQQGDSLHVFSDTLHYFRATDIAELFGEVTLVQGSKQLWTTGLTYHLKDRYGEYNHGGVLIDKTLQVSSRRGVYFADSEVVRFQDSVVVLHPKFNLAADSMRYIAPEAKVIFTGPTNIYTSSAKIYCEAGYYDLNTETAEFNLNNQYAGGQKSATADTIRYLANTAEVLMLGNVIVKENERRIDGASLRYLERTGETWITGAPAIYTDSTRSIRNPEIFYNEVTGHVTTKGRGILIDEDHQVEYDQSEYHESEGLGRFSGNVIWRDTTNRVGIMTENMVYGRETRYVLAYGPERSLFYSLVDQDTLFIAADTLHMWSETDTTSVPADTVQMIRAYHDVRLFKSDLQGRADSLVFHGRDSVFTFFGNPVLWSDTTQFSGDTIQLTVQQEQIRDITLIRKAIIISEIMALYYDQIKGKTIVAHFDSSAIREMWVHGNAEAVYYTRDDDEAFIGVNKTICSKMYFTFTEGKIHFLKYYGDNSSSLLPMRETNHDDLRLEGFEWRAGERPHHVSDLLK